MSDSISEEVLINRLPSNLGGSAHQSPLFYTPNSSFEEPSHRHPSNLGGSAHQSDQFFETEIEPAEEEEAESEGVQSNVSPSSQSDCSAKEPINQPSSKPKNLTAKYLNYYRPLFKAAQSGDWKTAVCFIKSAPGALTAVILSKSETVLHIAAQCCQWKFVRRLLELVSTSQSIAVKGEEGRTVLHIAAEGGSLKTAKALVEMNADLPQMVDNDRDLPLLYATYSKNKELVWYLSLKTRVEESPSSYAFIPSLPKILHSLIQAGYHDIALFFIQRFPLLALVKDEDKNSLIFWLADNPSYFFSGSNLGFFQKWIYKFVHVEIQSAYSLALQSITTQDTMLGWFKRLLWKAITQLAPSIKIVRDAKMTHECAIELVNHVVNQIDLSNMSYYQIRHFLKKPIYIAVLGGTEVIVRTLLRHFPDLTFIRVIRNRNILQAAIECRQENIVNIIKEISPIYMSALCSDNVKNINTLHLAGKLAPAFKLYSISGAALQMQRELQWFKEVEMCTLPGNIGVKDYKDLTAKDVFRLEHEMLSKDGEKWMKDTANSCMLVSTLIATVLFAAAFTVPGGNLNDKGIPIFLRSKAFSIFAISNAFGLFSSLTSLLMFLAILTARYDIEDFLESLPRKLIIGLGSLFFAIAAMIIAFGAALTIILSERWHWVSVPITLLASFPVAMFVMLQLPLFVQMVRSTYGASIFRPYPSRV